MKKFILCLTILAALNTAALADVMLGSWEGVTDGWIDWSGSHPSIGDATMMPSKYQYATIGATAGSQSLRLIKDGWNQNLALGMDYNQRVAFMANTKFAIDVTVPADIAGDGANDGYAQIYNVTINAEGYGWHDQFTSVPLNFYFWDGSGERTATLEIDYSAIKSSMPAIPGYIEIIIATNSSTGRGNFYFDNARLIPEPVTLALLGLGLTLLRKRS
ncbi:MAG: hypothetical protein A2Y10_09945 [Planctomycetes bacterium GWF2_41_51]|nr:MAG: hypothetical protein A2Y10_09945 [Planctomycetes bacterium GWF2_41_51]HBG26451.1 hypothetical protein [Phycisphaerales bacterium]